MLSRRGSEGEIALESNTARSSGRASLVAFPEPVHRAARISRSSSSQRVNRSLKNLTSFSFMPSFLVRDHLAGLSKSVIRVTCKRPPRLFFFRPGVRVERWPFARGVRLYPAGMRMSIRFAGRGVLHRAPVTAWLLKGLLLRGFGG